MTSFHCNGKGILCVVSVLLSSAKIAAQPQTTPQPFGGAEPPGRLGRRCPPWDACSAVACSAACALGGLA